MRKVLAIFVLLTLFGCSKNSNSENVDTRTPTPTPTEMSEMTTPLSTSTSSEVPPTVEPALASDSRIAGTDLLTTSSECQIADITDSDSVTSGFPRPKSPDQYLSLRVLTVPMSTSDFLFDDEDLAFANTAIEKSATYWREMSYGRFELQATVLPKDNWVTLDQTAQQLGIVAGGPTTDYQSLIEKAITEVSQEIDTSSYDFFFVAMPAVDNFLFGQSVALTDTFISDQGRRQTAIFVGGGYLRFWETVAHEIGHAGFDLEDLYSTEQQANLMGDWDIMQMAILVPSKEITTWSRWLLGWIPDTQIQCITVNGPYTLFIDPVEATTDLPKAIVVKTSDHSALVIETRRNAGYDVSGPATLVYTVDTSVRTGAGPYRYEGILANIGEELTIGNSTVSLADSNTEGDLLTVSVR